MINIKDIIKNYLENSISFYENNVEENTMQLSHLKGITDNRVREITDLICMGEELNEKIDELIGYYVWENIKNDNNR